ncbi:glycosyltransferase [Hazenella sp. IB182357]|uniref:Glycosyltransferase n=1 Tax=Polycladospora coralii TaxID=2771432 RepID=A0A926RTB8_9BACL|nr:glycosyltransferase [Polycladospora coralii]MBD1371147.1 glycosyltransferase [Polycladospora coralii]MBS7530089.1 glycosyltransferase [Polycladospora coralii]
MSILRNGVSVIQCTNKFNVMENIFSNYGRQTFKNKEMILILNHDNFDEREWRIRAAHYPAVRVFKVPGAYTLGQCLNLGVRKSRYEVLAKFDDDDYYGENYLRSSMRALQNTKIDFVVRKNYYLYLTERQALYIHRNGRHGGCFVWRRWISREIPFINQNTDEDVQFINAALARGCQLFRTTDLDYVYIRNNLDQHTWKVGVDELISYGYQFVTNTRDFTRYLSK